MKNPTLWLVFVGLSTAFLLPVRRSHAEPDEMSRKLAPLSKEEKVLFEGAAKVWFQRLWTNDCSQSKAGFRTRKVDTRPWMTSVEVSFRVDGKLCTFQFADRETNRIVLVNNHLYRRIISYDGEKYRPPVHTTQARARARVSEFAALFGVSNLWDKTAFSAQSERFDSEEETWRFDFLTIRNGYPFPDGICVAIADLPGAPLALWNNAQDDIPPDQLPTNVVLTAEQARVKALEYMAKYFPYKEAALYKGQTLEKGDVPEMKCYTNRLEYVIPNYNYIRPAPGKGGLSDYVAKKCEIALAWVNYLGTPKNSKYNIGATIYVDAATGEMLGGCD